MEVFLSSNCESFTGELNSKCGYYIRQFKGHWIGQRKAKGNVPTFGHWMFIVNCAELVKAKLYFSDIKVSSWEVFQALQEGGWAQNLRPSPEEFYYNAQQILELAQEYPVSTADEKIPLETICERLERAIDAKVGMNGLKTLLYGWRRCTKRIEQYTLYNRAARDGYPWLSSVELRSFSRYAGYDLMNN